jgi:uncharacterized protein YyaL (SSP411 family)
MAHESFEDPATARLMNSHFINIKVDREERPDIDRIYQLAHRILTQQGGGWPLTMFLDPDTQLPFFGGTYFPKTASYQLPGFTDLLARIHETFRSKRNDLKTTGDKLSGLLDKLSQATHASLKSQEQSANYSELAQLARDQLNSQYDERNGGFGRAPKFPNPSALEFLFEHWAYRKKQDPKALDMVMITLTKMARGGIYDHLGGGFCRYATDERWMIPHFEKMLYDNGALLKLYANALRVGPDVLFSDVVTDTIDWLVREMRHPAGGFYAAQDADSEGEEGKFYLWQRKGVKKLLSEDEYSLIETLYSLDKPANFEGRWNFHRNDSWRSVIARVQLEPTQARKLLVSAKAKLFAKRAERTPPGLDDKLLAGWNGLVIEGLASAALYANTNTSNCDQWLAQAQQAMDFVRTEMVKDGRLYATWKNGQARHPAYLDDYAFCLAALLKLLEVQWREQDVAFAIVLADNAIELFAAEGGGFYFTANDHEALIHRPMPTMDEATASGNAVLGCALHDLGHLLAHSRYTDAALQTLRWASRFAAQQPTSHCAMLGLAARHIYPQQQIILRGSAPAEWLAACREGFVPGRRSYAIPFEGTRTLPAYIPRMVDVASRNRVTAYMCSGMACAAPITRLEELQLALKTPNQV